MYFIKYLIYKDETSLLPLKKKKKKKKRNIKKLRDAIEMYWSDIATSIRY